MLWRPLPKGESAWRENSLTVVELRETVYSASLVFSTASCGCEKTSLLETSQSASSTLAAASTNDFAPQNVQIPNLSQKETPPVWVVFLFGRGRRIRTLTDGFGDRCATIDTIPLSILGGLTSVM